MGTRPERTKPRTTAPPPVEWLEGRDLPTAADPARRRRLVGQPELVAAHAGPQADGTVAPRADGARARPPEIRRQILRARSSPDPAGSPTRHLRPSSRGAAPRVPSSTETSRWRSTRPSIPPARRPASRPSSSRTSRTPATCSFWTSRATHSRSTVRGRPTRFTWTVNGSSGGTFSGATGQGTVEIRYQPGGKLPDRARSAGVAVSSSGA